MSKIINDFTHLHRHDSFSLLDGLGLPEQAAKKASELGFTHLAISNHASSDSLIKHQLACEKYNVIPIAGVEFYITQNPDQKEKGTPRGHITVWIKNTKGYVNVLKMLSLANLNYFYHRPRIGFETLLSHAEGLCVGTACSASFLHLDGGIDYFGALHEEFGDDLYLEVMPFDYDNQIKTNNMCLDLSEQFNVKLIATNDCFVKGTVVLTDCGAKAIEEIIVGDNVLTHKNRFRRVLHLNNRGLKENESVYKIKTNIGSLCGEATGTHPYYTCSYNSNEKKLYDFKWKKVEKLEVRDYLVIPKIGDIFCREERYSCVDLLDFYKKPRNLTRSSFFEGGIEFVNSIRAKDREIKIPRFLEIDDDFLTVLGIYIAQGCCHKRKINFAVPKRSEWQADLIIDYFNKFNLSPKKVQSKNGEYFVIAFTSAVFEDVLASMCGRGSGNKHLPIISKLFHSFSNGWTREQLLKILFGYTTSDGSISKNSVQVGATTSKRLAYELSFLLNSWGILCFPEIREYNGGEKHKNPNANPANWNTAYILNLASFQAEKYCSDIGIEWKRNIGVARKRFVESDNFFAVKIKEIKNMEYCGNVFNFEVEEDNSYTANGYIVHNCHYIEADDHSTHDVLLACQIKKKLNDPNRWRFSCDGLYLCEPEFMVERFKSQGVLTDTEIQSAMANTMEVARKCENFRIERKEVSLPIPPQYIGMDEEEVFKQLIIAGAKKRLGVDICL